MVSYETNCHNKRSCENAGNYRANGVKERKGRTSSVCLSGKLPAKTVEKRGKQVYVIAEEELEMFRQEHEIKTARKERKGSVAKFFK